MLPALVVLGLIGASIAVAATRDHGHGDDNDSTFTARLSGHQEVPAVHTAARGKVSLTVNADNTISFKLMYSGLSTPALFSHVHFGQRNVNGSVSFFFCGGGGKPACPAGTTTPATVTGTVTTADILGVTTQGLPAGDMAAIVSEIRAGFAYANVHSQQSPGGEIRGQLRGHEDEDH